MTTYEQALEQSVEYFNGDSLAAEVFLSKYAMTRPDGNVLEPTPDYMHRRMAKELARIEAKHPNPLSEAVIYDHFKNFEKIVPQGSPMAGIGNPFQVMSLSNCFVIDSPADSYGGILKADQEEAQLMKRRGGVGFDISKIRPKGIITNNAAKTTDGLGVFMDRFSNTCKEVGQGGRRGALMLTISVHHPEIETFVTIKNNRNRVTGANISIRLTDEFMNAVKNDEDFEMRWPVDSSNPQIVKRANARKLWDTIIESAHAHAEPGLLFWDTVIKNSPADIYASKGFGTVSTNPCGEITLSPYDSCRLLVVNTLSFVKNAFTSKARFDYKGFTEAAGIAQRLMDDIIDLEIENIDKILNKIAADPESDEVKRTERELWTKVKAACINGRRTGTGVTAVGDTIAALGQIYGTDESVKTTEKLYKALALGTYRSSVQMAKERGAFPAFEYELEKDHTFINRIMNLDPQMKADWQKYGRRNIANTTTAPCGSVSVETQTTSGIEPTFMVSYTRRKKVNPNDQGVTVAFTDAHGDEWQEYTVYHHGFQKWMDATGLTKVEDSPYHGACSDEIDWVGKVKMQAAAQKWVCHSISNTTNIPADTTVDVVKDVYMAGWESGCKGVTVYRAGCRDGVLIDTKALPADTENKSRDKFLTHHAPSRPEELPCDIFHMTVRGEKWNMFVGKYDERPFEVFAGRAEFVSIPKSKKSGTIRKNGVYNLCIGEGEDELTIKDLATVFENSTESAFTRTISLALRHGTQVQYVVEQLEKGADKDSDMFSLGKALMRVLKKYIADGSKPSQKLCTNCSSPDLAYQEGCITCTACGASKCS